MLISFKRYASAILCVLSCCWSAFAASHQVKDYVPDIRLLAMQDSPCIAIRSCIYDGEPSYCAIFPNSCTWRIVPKRDVLTPDSGWPAIYLNFASTPYCRALARSLMYEDSYEDAGIRHVATRQSGVALTMDLCPSHHPLDRKVFAALIRKAGAAQKPVSVGLSITGTWIKQHPRDLEYLDSCSQVGDLAITWINHTYHHRYDTAASILHNFLLEPGTRVQNEVLLLEKALLEKGLTPSPFFRFPGLVSNRSLVMRVNRYGCIIVGTDAWLAKNQKPVDGSIVLIHANGNEPYGIHKFIELLNSRSADIANGQWRFLDLASSMATEMNVDSIR